MVDAQTRVRSLTREAQSPIAKQTSIAMSLNPETLIQDTTDKGTSIKVVNTVLLLHVADLHLSFSK